MQRQQERRRVIWAVLASIVLHLIVAVSLSAFNHVLAPPPLAVEEELPEITMMDLSEPPAPVLPPKAPFIDVDESKQVEKAPDDAIFESSANTEARSERDATGNLPLPSQDGRERPFLNTETQDHSLASRGAQTLPEPAPQPQRTPPPTPTPVSSPKPTATPAPSPTPAATIREVASPPPLATPEPEQLAMLTATPPPPLKNPDETETFPTPPALPTPEIVPTRRPQPEAPTTAYQPQKEQTRVTGNITKRGASSVGAARTPLGAFQQKIFDAIGSRWYSNMKDKGDLATIGTARLEAHVDERGQIQNLKVVTNNANEAFANICLQSFQEARIPPIPPDLVPTLPDGRLLVEVSFTHYTNR